MTIRNLSITAALLSMLAACGGGGGDPVLGAPAVVRLSLSPPVPAVQVGQTVQLTATAYDADNRVVTGRTVQWNSNAPAIASVSTAGLVTAHSTGPARITAAVGTVTAAVDIAVSEAPPTPVARVEVTATSTTVEEGSSLQFAATAYDAQNNVITGRGVTWSVQDPSIATVYADGLVVALRPGATTATARIDGRQDSLGFQIQAHYDFDLVYGRYAVGVHPAVVALDIRDPAAVPRNVALPGPTVQQAAPSPDGTRFVYAVTETWGTTINVADRDGSNAVVIFNSAGISDQPAWSPDGSRIAFRHRPPGSGTDILVVDASNGGNLLNVTAVHGATSQGWPAWSPVLQDGSAWIAYSHAENGAAQIWAVRDDGTGTRQVTTNMSVYDDQPNWSPDGTRIVYQRSGTAVFGDLYVVSAAGGNGGLLMPLAGPLAGGQFAPTWSPDGRLIAFSSGHASDYYQIYTVWADGTRLARRTQEDADHDFPRWMLHNN